MDTPLAPGLYIVATPIGNLGDIAPRAAGVLRGVAAVACEDTRVTGKLLQHLGVKQKLVRYDDHASDATRDYLLGMAAEQPIALVSDAGTPLISDPGYRLVRTARALLQPLGVRQQLFCGFPFGKITGAGLHSFLSGTAGGLCLCGNAGRFCGFFCGYARAPRG